MKYSETVDTFYTGAFGSINQLKYHGETIEYQRVVETILRSLPTRFETLVMTLEENKDMLIFTIDELQDSLINHEHRINRSNTSLECAFTSQSSISRGRGRGRGRNFSRVGHNSSPANVTGREQNQNPSQPSGHGFYK